MTDQDNTSGLTTTYHVGLPIASAGTIEVGNVIHVDRQSFIVTKVGGAAFDMVPACEVADCGYPAHLAHISAGTVERLCDFHGEVAPLSDQAAPESTATP